MIYEYLIHACVIGVLVVGVVLLVDWALEESERG